MTGFGVNNKVLKIECPEVVNTSDEHYESINETPCRVTDGVD